MIHGFSFMRQWLLAGWHKGWLAGFGRSFPLSAAPDENRAGGMDRTGLANRGWQVEM